MNTERYYLLTGAAGFLGTNICMQLLEAGCKVRAIGETTGTLLQIIKGEMPMGMQGSFNLCDVRDLAAGTIAAIDKGRIGECYILANEPVTLKEMCDMLHEECDAKKIKFYLPLNMADKLAQAMEKQAEKSGKKPLMTTFSVYNLARNNVFDYSKARKELGYTTRSYQETIHDEVQWMIAEGLIDGSGVTAKPALMTNDQIREGGYMEDIVKAMEHDVTDVPPIDVEATYKAIEQGVVGTYQKIEDTVVGSYKKLEDGAVSGFTKITDKFVETFFTHDGETVEEAKERLKR